MGNARTPVRVGLESRDGWPAGFSGRVKSIQLRQGEDEVASIIDPPAPLLATREWARSRARSFKSVLQGDTGGPRTGFGRLTYGMFYHPG